MIHGQKTFYQIFFYQKISLSTLSKNIKLSLMNPFRFGTAVEEKFFIGRRQELKQLISHVTSGQNILVYGDRKIGKTSLLQRLINKLKPQTVCVYVDLWGIKTTEDFCLRFLKSLEKIKTYKSNFLKLLKIIKSLKPTVQLDDHGEPLFSYALESYHQELAIDELMELLQKLVGKKKTLVIFDEFQEISLFDNRRDNFEIKAKLRSLIQFQKNITYIYCGSIRHILLDMFENQNEPFYESALKFPLGTIPLKDFHPYIKKNFANNQRMIEDQEIKKVYEIAEEVPNNIQQLCYFIFDISKEKQKITAAIIEKGLNQLLDSETPRFSEIYRNLTKTQQNAVVALSYLKKGESFFSPSYFLRFHLKSTQELSDSLKSLIHKNLIFKGDTQYYVFKSIWLKYWIKRMRAKEA